MNCVSRGGSYLVNSFCDVQEENNWTKESYQACWISLVLETRPQYRQTLSKKDCIGKEGYEQQQVVHFIVERNMNQTLKLSSSGDTKEHLLPLSGKNRAPAKDGNAPTASERRSIMETLDSSAKKPTQTKFRAVHLMSSPREVSHLGQNRE